MLKKKTVIGVFVLLALAGGFFWHRHVQRVMNAEPVRVYKVSETQKAAETTGGHWHGDEWHAEPHPVPAVVEPPVDAAPAAPRLREQRTRELLEELRAIVAVPLPPNADELYREHYALTEEAIVLSENAHTLSEAEHIKAVNDLSARQLAWNKRFLARSRAREAAIEREAAVRRARKRRELQREAEFR